MTTIYVKADAHIEPTLCLLCAQSVEKELTGFVGELLRFYCLRDLPYYGI